MSNASVLIWGPFGFIGTHLTAALLSRGHRVMILSRPVSLYEDPGWLGQVERFELMQGRDNTATIRRAVSGASIVYDLAGMSGAVATNREPIQSLDSDCRSQLEFLNACASAGNKPHVVFSSSRLVYGETGREPVAEDHPVSPRSIYAAHRLCVENYLQIYARLGHITYTVCRISNTYGYSGARHSANHGILNRFLRAAVEGKPITLFGDGSQLRDYIYIADLAESLIRCGIRPAARNQIFNLGSGASTTMRDAASLIRDLTGAPPLHFAPWPDEWGTVETGDYVANTGKARSLLGVRCDYDLEAGVAETVELYRRAQFVPAESGVEMGRAVRSAQA